MEIISIYPLYIYSIKYKEEIENEFDRLFAEWMDVENLLDFMERNKDYLNSSVWKRVFDPELAVRQVLDEAEGLESLFEDLFINTKSGVKPNFDSHFHFLEGKYKYELHYIPMKSYSSVQPSLLRIYAIKMAPNTYLITGGGIKLADTIQNSPELNEHVIQNIDRVRDWLKANGIMDSDDMNK
ncbi:MAG: hypothetical protein ACRCZM_11545 [Bacteroidales bacterium]